MKNIYIKTSLLSIVAFSMLFSCVNVFAEQTETVVKTITSRIEFAFIEPKVDHEQIDTVFANGILNAKVEAIFGDATYADAVLEYKIDSGDICQVTKEDISDGSPFYIGTPKGKITKDNSTVDYRVKVLFKSSEGDFTIYAPEDASETNFVTANVISKIEDNINGDAGGEISRFCGDQSKGDNGTAKVTVPAGTYSGNHKVTVNFIKDDDAPSPSSSLNEERENVLSIVSVEVEGNPQLNHPIQVDNLPLQTEATQANKFIMQYKNGEDWETAETANLNVDKVNQIFSFAVDNLGYYKVLESVKLTNSSYRPVNRIVVKGKIGERYPGFEFKYLKEGDSITIYNLKGKKIRKISASGTESDVWDGKKDNGDWAKSGIYIYQIKVDGKLVSGTIVFVY